MNERTVAGRRLIFVEKIRLLNELVATMTDRNVKIVHHHLLVVNLINLIV